MYRPRPINSGISRRILISLHGIANFELVREVVRMCAHTSSTMKYTGYVEKSSLFSILKMA